MSRHFFWNLFEIVYPSFKNIYQERYLFSLQEALQKTPLCSKSSNTWEYPIFSKFVFIYKYRLVYIFVCIVNSHFDYFLYSLTHIYLTKYKHHVSSIIRKINIKVFNSIIQLSIVSQCYNLVCIRNT